MRTRAATVTVAWTALMLAAVLSGWLAEGWPDIGWVALGISLLAAVKVLIVMSEFMELRTAPTVWQCLMAGWLVLVTGVLVAGHFLVTPL